MKILLATTNPHKLEEIKQVFDHCNNENVNEKLDVDFVLLGDIGKDIKEPVEDEETFEGNAILKARYYAQETGYPCLADDSGLEVDSLDGAPGIYSARYSGVEGGREIVDVENNKKLMKELAGKSADDRVGRFVCAMAYVEPITGQGVVVRGKFEGRIILDKEADDQNAIHQGRGANGFGYDPLFWLEDTKCSSAELTPEQKNARSHRGDASRLMWEALKNMVMQ